jgi:glutamate synthase domain-containing protein 2
MRTMVYATLAAVTLFIAMLALKWHWLGWVFLVLVPLWCIAIYDSIQQEHSLRRNFPLIGRGRWLMELMRPFIRQYFLESDTDGAPINRMFRSIVYQRAKGDIATLPYGTRLNTYEAGYEWLGHSLAATNVEDVQNNARVLVGGDQCQHKYSASVLNISAMSYGALSSAAIVALNKAANAGNFYHNTGEGGLSHFHLENGGDIVWQVGTGYFGCRTPDGRFDEALFREKAQQLAVKMIELKLSQGAKPGHGGILPASKNTLEIAAIRVVPVGEDVISPSTHPEFNTPVEMMEFIGRLREASGGKPIGFKLCIGRRIEFMDICKAMLRTGIKPDFVTVDGGEGGTGAAPLEYSNSVGMPLLEGLAFVDDCLRGFGVRDEIKIIAAGKIITSFHMAKTLALGADIINSARGMMLALGCVQSLVCHTNRCPTGIATQDPKLIKGLVVEDKYKRVQRFQAQTVHALSDLMSSTGVKRIGDLHRSQIFRRVNHHEILRYDQIFPEVASGAFLQEPYPAHYADLLELASSDNFI